MKTYAFRFAVGIVAFAFGTALATARFSDFLPDKFLSKSEISATAVQVQTTEQTGELSFNEVVPAVLACGGNSPTARSSYNVSDGSKIEVVAHRFDSEKQARKKIDSIFRRSAKILEQSPILKDEGGSRFVVEVENEILIVSLSKIQTKEAKWFVLTTITAPSLRHALAFERYREDYRKSMLMWSRVSSGQ